jgi:hypothetical protein
MLRRVALVRTDVSGELSASFIRVIRIGKLGTTMDVTSDRLTKQKTKQTPWPLVRKRTIPTERQTDRRTLRRNIGISSSPILVTLM